MKKYIICALSLVVFNYSFANILYVSDYPSIQEAIDISAPADTVILDTVVYHEYLTIDQHGLTLASFDLFQPDTTIIESTCISGNNPEVDEQSLLVVDGPFQDSLIIHGITFKDGNRLPDGTIAGLDITNVNTRISRNIFQDFSARQIGAIRIDSSNVSFNNNLVINNYSEVNIAGMLCINSNFQISDNIFTGNSVFDGEGGGISIGNSRGIINSNTFHTNQGCTYGSGIFLYPHGKVTIENNSFINNNGSAGCGIFSVECDTLMINNNYFFENHAIIGPNWRGDGAAIHLWGFPEQIVDISWNIFDSNLADNHSAVALGCFANFHHNQFINNIGKYSSAILSTILSENVPHSVGWKNLFYNNSPIQGFEDDYYGVIASGPSSILTISQSDFINNEVLAATTTPGGQYLTNNYWGHETGPCSAVQNPDGQGDSLGGWLNPHPFSTEHFWNPNINIADSLISFDTLAVDSTVERSFFIHNTGVLTLELTAIAPDSPEFTVQQLSDSSILEDDSLEVTLLFNSESPGVFESSLLIFSNDTTDAIYTLPLVAICEGSAVDNRDENSTPEFYFITDAYPNPFNNSTTVKVNLPQRSNLKLILYNLQGQVEAIINEKTLNQGLHSFVIKNSNLASGTYFLHASVAGKMNEVRKLVLIK